MSARQGRFGFPIRLPKSVTTVARVAPIFGWTPFPDLEAPVGSLVSAQNLWVRDKRLEPRHRLATLGLNNPWQDVPNGAFPYDDITGVTYPMVTSAATVAYLADGGTWTPLTYAASSTSNFPPAGGRNDLYFGTSVYLPRRDLNIEVFTNGVDPLFAWGGPADGLTYSTLTQAPIARDVALFDNRPVAWNIRELTNANRFVTRMAWPVAGDPEDWLGIGAGTDDLVDMRGQGTRIFASEDELIFGSTREIWRGRRVGLPFVFEFSPIAKAIGMAHPRAAIQTPDGIFWLHSDYMVYQLAGGTITPVGAPIQRELHDTIIDRDTAFFTHHADIRQLSLWYSADGGYANRAFTFNTLNGTWTPHRTVQRLSVGFSGQPQSASSSVTWNALVGTFAQQTQTFQQLLGVGQNAADAVVSSTGTAYIFSPDATTDDGQVVLHEGQLGALWADSSNRLKHVAQVRIDCQANSASSLSVAISTNLGTTFPYEQRFAPSLQSHTSQVEIHCNLSGTYGTVRVRDDSGGNWSISGLQVVATYGPET